jgi:hypothetical protein
MAAVVLAPGLATAKRGYFVLNPSQTMEAHLRGSKGFGLSLFANGGQVYLSVKGHNASVQYATTGSASTRRIKAKFDGLGRVSMRFRPTARPHLVPEPDGNCKGEGESVQPGTFVGKFVFRGEQGYTAAHVARARGTITRKMKQTCRYGNEGGRPSLAGWTLLHATKADGAISVVAFSIESPSHPAAQGSIFSASLIEFRRPGMSIFRTIESHAGLDAFRTVKSHGKVISATIEPPAPFSGSATYLGTSSSPSESWTGSLAGDFPGVGPVNLAGSDFCAESALLANCGDSDATQVAVSVGS